MLGVAIDLASAKAAAWWQSVTYLAADMAGTGIWPPGFAASFSTALHAQTDIGAAAIPSTGLADITRLSPSCFGSQFAFSRASEASCVGADGVLSVVAADLPRFDFSNGRRQLLLEGSSTNHVRNNVMLGTAAGIIGSGGALPTNWSASGTSLTRTVVGSGSTNGVDYVDLRYHGTVGDANGAMLAFEGQTDVAASSGERWSLSAYVALVSGSLATASNVRLTLREGTAGGGFVVQLNSADIKSQIGTGLKRFGHSATLSGGVTTAFVQPRLLITATAGSVLDFTLRVGVPQCERQPLPSSVIRTAGSTGTRAADDCRLGTVAAAMLARPEAGLLIKGSGVSGGSGALLGGAGGERLVSFNAGQTTLGLGDASPLVVAGSLTTPLASFGLAAGWDATGRAGSYSGGSVQSDASVLDVDLSAASLGRNDGTSAFASGWYDELAIYPFRPSNDALTALSAPLA